jgi:hypothetical protein
MIQVIGGIAAGAAVMMMAPSIISVIAGAFKPVTKTLIKSGILALESGKQIAHGVEAAFASSVEAIEDITAEARAEIAEGHKTHGKTGKKKEA